MKSGHWLILLVVILAVAGGAGALGFRMANLGRSPFVCESLNEGIRIEVPPPYVVDNVTDSPFYISFAHGSRDVSVIRNQREGLAETLAAHSDSPVKGFEVNGIQYDYRISEHGFTAIGRNVPLLIVAEDVTDETSLMAILSMISRVQTVQDKSAQSEEPTATEADPEAELRETMLSLVAKQMRGETLTAEEQAMLEKFNVTIEEPRDATEEEVGGLRGHP